MDMTRDDWARLARALAAETLGTALLVWLGLGSLVMRDGSEAPLPHVAQAFGCLVVGLCTALGPVSGAHLNPAVSLAAALSGAASPARAAAYAAAQLLGGVLGFAALLGTMAPAKLADEFGVSLPAPHVGALGAVFLEAALTGLLALACCAHWAAAAPDPAGPIKLGLLIAGLVYAGGPSTGASLNPARSFGPALLQNQWQHQWVYWVGPLGGAALAAGLHRLVLRPLPPPLTPRPEPEEVPLDDKHYVP